MILGLGTGAVICSQTSLNCHLREAPEIGVEDFEGVGARTPTLPADLRTTVVARGLRQPTDFAFLPDGRVLVAERAGVLLLLEPNGRLGPVVLDIRSRIQTRLFRGLVDVTVDPDFATNRFVYVLYAVERVGAADDAPTTARLSRFVMRGQRANPSDEQILLGNSPGPSCLDLPRTADCLPADINHIGADIVFRDDDTMFVTTGEGGGGPPGIIVANAFLSQGVDSLGGKVLRIDREGRGVAHNPFWNGDAKANRSKVWALGLRNPFRLSFERTAGLLIVGGCRLRDGRRAQRRQAWAKLRLAMLRGPGADTPLRGEGVLHDVLPREGPRGGETGGGDPVARGTLSHRRSIPAHRHEAPQPVPLELPLRRLAGQQAVAHADRHLHDGRGRRISAGAWPESWRPGDDLGGTRRSRVLPRAERRGAASHHRTLTLGRQTRHPRE